MNTSQESSTPPTSNQEEVGTESGTDTGGDSDTDIKRSNSIIRHRGSSMGNDADLVKKIARKWSKNSMDFSEERLNTNTLLSPEEELSSPSHPNPYEEIAEIHAERDALETAFDAKIDPEGNGDVDIDEWINGLKAIEVELSEPDMKKLFQMMNRENNGFIDRNDFATMLMKNYETPELKRLRHAVLSKIMTEHQKKRSKLLQAVDASEWDQYDLMQYQKEMQDAMENLVTTLQDKFAEEEKFDEELKGQKTKNPEFGKPSRANEWTVHEVVAWLNILGYPNYSRAFIEEAIDGNTLLHDLDEPTMRTELAVKGIHARKILREISGLKRAIREKNDIPLDIELLFDLEVHYEPQTIFKEEMNKLRDQVNYLQKLKDDMTLEHQNQIENLNNQIKSLNTQISKLKSKSGSESSDESNHEDDEIENEDIVLSSNNNNNNIVAIDQNNISNINTTDNIQKNGDNIPNNDNVSGIEKSDKKNLQSKLKKDKKLKHKKSAIKLIKLVTKMKQDEGDKFANIERLTEWTTYEVIWWLNSINFPQYAAEFDQLQVDGDMLIRDIGLDTLIEDLQVKKLHSGRILREIGSLKKSIRLSKGFDESFMTIISIPSDNKSSKLQIESLEKKVEELNKEKSDLYHEIELLQQQQQQQNDTNSDNNDPEQQPSGFLANKIDELEKEKSGYKNQIDQLNNKINQLKEEHENKIIILNNEINALKLQKEKEKEKEKEQENDKDKKYDDNNKEEKRNKDNDIKTILDPEYQELVDEIKKKADEDMDFANPERVLEWNTHEVCYWLITIEFDIYIPSFADAYIDGSILVSDVDPKVLTQDLGVKPLHVNKILRGIERLRSQSKQRVPAPKDKMDNLTPEQQIQLLTQELKEEKQKRKAFELELDNLRIEHDGHTNSSGKKTVNELEEELEYVKLTKIETIKEMSDQMETLRQILRIMQKEVQTLKTPTPYSRVDSLMGYFGYERK